MVKFFLLPVVFIFIHLGAQFRVSLQSTEPINVEKAYLYSYIGSESIIETTGISSDYNKSWTFKVDKPYYGLLKVYFPGFNGYISLVSENKDINAKVIMEKGLFSSIKYNDVVNKNFYDFLEGRVDSIANISGEYPFSNFYSTKLRKFVDGDSSLTLNDYIQFLSTAPNYLETSAEIRFVLYNYMKLTPRSEVKANVNKLLDAIDVESSRGQIVLSEFINLFDMYGWEDLRDNFLKEAKNLKCSINTPLENTIKNNEKVAIGATMEDYTFSNTIHTKAKKLYDIKSKYKLIMFWSSTCSHCEKEMPLIIDNYKKLKSLGIEVIGFSFDSDKDSYYKTANMLLWINNSELKGWDSSASDLYNIHATPTYFYLDSENKIISKPYNFSAFLSTLK